VPGPMSHLNAVTVLFAVFAARGAGAQIGGESG